MQIRKKIANLCVEITSDASSEALALLDSELTNYPAAEKDMSADIVIQYTDASKLLGEAIPRSNNPALFTLSDNSVSMNFHHTKINWSLRNDSGPLNIRVASDWSKRSWQKKFRSMQYTHPFENIGQIFHELLLIPTLQMFYSEQLAVLHGSAVISPDGDVSIFGGTGGVGKTSLMLELARERGYQFLADDISIINSDATVFANLAFPKIYGYNTLGVPDMKKQLLGGKGVMDRLAWNLKMKLRGPSSVRRRIDPEVFFPAGVAQQGSLKNYYILFRSSSPKLEVNPIDIDTTIQMNHCVMRAEYSNLYRHLHWYEYNTIGTGESADPGLVYRNIWSNSERIQREAFAKANCFQVNVPDTMKAQDLKSQLAGMVG